MLSNQAAFETINDVHDAVHRRGTSAAPAWQFPLPALRESLQRLCTALATEHGVPSETVIMVCLWTLMHAAVLGARLCGAGVENPVDCGADVLLIIQHAAMANQTLLNNILRPLMDAQAALAEASERLDANKLGLREAQLRRAYDQILRRDRFPDPAHLDFLRNELDRIQTRRQPLLIIKDPSASQLEEALLRCLDNAPGLVLTDVSSNTEILERLTKLKPKDPHGPSEYADPTSCVPEEPSAPTTTAISAPGSQLALLCCWPSDFVDDIVTRGS